jgi:hypothetical protein
MRSRTARALTALLVAGLLGGCLGEPEIEDRWTILDIEGANLTPYQAVPPGSRDSIQVSTAITYRKIVTGVAVAELRASSIPVGSVTIHPDATRLTMAQEIDLVLQNSVSLGRATRAVTGWDHLIQRIDFMFDATIPATDSTGMPPNLFLVCYLGQGTEVERADGTDTLIVTPFVSTDMELLPVGMELAVGGPGPH